MNVSIGDVVSVSKGMFQHVGVSLGNNLVFHNTPVIGETVTTLSYFSNGRDVSIIRQVNTSEVPEILNRISDMLLLPRKYNVVENNCDHTMYSVVEGKARSPQLAFWGLLALVTILIAINRK